MSGPRIPSLLIGAVLIVIGGGYLLGEGPAGPTALILLMVGLGVAALLTLLLRRGPGATDTGRDERRPPEA